MAVTLDLDAIEARVNAASAGPWEFDGDDTIEGGNGGGVCVLCEHKSFATFKARGEWYSSADAAFIAAARSDVPALLAEVRLSHALLRDAISCIRNPTYTMVDLREYADRLEKVLNQ
jgi:hypothetical protein